jgi:hypothetical protein
MIRSFFYQFGPSYLPTDGGPRDGLRSAHPNYNGRPTIIKNTGTLAAGGTTTVTLAATASAVLNDYNNHYIVTTGGTGSGQQRKITGYTTGRVATVDTAFSPATDATTTYSVYLNRDQHAVDSIVGIGGVGVASYHDVFTPTGQETLIINESPHTATMTIPINPNTGGNSPLGTQASAEDLRALCEYALAKGVAMIPLREAFTRNL